MPRLMLKPGREKSLLRRHPWVFSGAVARIEGDPAPGETLEVVDHRGRWLAQGGYSPSSQIVARVWTFDPAVSIDEAFFSERIHGALAWRQERFGTGSDVAYRLIHAESDGLPGLVVDRYGDQLVCQFLFRGVEAHKETIVGQLAQAAGVRGVYERSDESVRKAEGLLPVAGPLWGETPERIQIVENGVLYLIDLHRGHKTGFYLDQRDSRSRLGVCAARKTVLNCFSYTGGFGLAALQGGATSVINVDSSAEALAQAEENRRLNGFDAEAFRCVRANVFEYLRQCRTEGRQFDLIVLDPPKFVEGHQHLAKATRAYKDINWLAFQLLRPGGRLFTFSCSGRLPRDLFQKIVSDAALDAGVEAQIVGELGASADHPVALPFPEGAYLKGLICRRV